MSDPEISESARRLGKIPKQRRYTRTCPICGTVFETTARGVYDKAICRAKAQTERLRGQRKAATNGDELDGTAGEPEQASA